MVLRVLTENCAGSGFLAEHGLSYLIEKDDDRFLFDTGHTDVYLKNAQSLGLDIINNVNTVILSHGHWDHGDGLQYINNKTLVAHPNIFIKRYRKKDATSIGLKLNRGQIEEKFNLILKSEPYFISKNVLFLGQIPRTNDFESKTTPFNDELGNDDFVDDDSAIAIIENNELIIISGCSHSGICNIIEYACFVTGINTINAVIGGFHLKQSNLQTMYTLNYLKAKNVKKIYPSHCTELPALAAFHDEYYIDQLKTGMTIKF